MSEFDEKAAELIAYAFEHGRWKTPIGWFAENGASLEHAVSVDLESMVGAYESCGRSELARHVAQWVANCTRGVDEEGRVSWCEFIDDITVAAMEFVDARPL